MTDEQKLQAIRAAGLPIDEVINGSFTPSRPLTSDEMLIASDILNPPSAQELADRGDDRTLKEQYSTTVTQLQVIENYTSPNNAQVIAAIKYLAKTQRLMIKFIARRYFL